MSYCGSNGIYLDKSKPGHTPRYRAEIVIERRRIRRRFRTRADAELWISCMKSRGIMGNREFERIAGEGVKGAER